MKFYELILKLLSPPHCICCNESLDIRVTDYICEKCANNLPKIDEKRCEVCGIPINTPYGDLICKNCKHTKRYFVQNISRYSYKDGIDTAIKAMKFGNDQIWIAKTLGNFLSKTIIEHYSDIKFDFATYVPLSKERYLERKFNQSQEIAISVCENLGLELKNDILIKVRDTPCQSGLKLKDRINNVKNAYKVKNHELVEDKTILLIDDVFTSGSTLNECCKTLKKSGATCVYACTVAIVHHE